MSPIELSWTAKNVRLFAGQAENLKKTRAVARQVVEGVLTSRR